jgi:hypothetical protein
MAGLKMRNEELGIRNREKSHVLTLFLVICSLLSVIWSCDYGEIGGADQTVTFSPVNAVFTERMNFLCGDWYSHYAGIGRLDGYIIRKWSDFTDADKARARSVFSGLDVDNLQTYSSKKVPQNGDYVLIYDDTVYGQAEDNSESNGRWGFSFMGLVRAINIFNGDKNRGAIIIEYFEGTDPLWLSDPDSGAYQNLTRGEKPFFGIYFRVLSQDTVQMANAVDLAALYAGNHYYTEKATFDEARETNGVENESEFISWGVVIPQDRVK